MKKSFLVSFSLMIIKLLSAQDLSQYSKYWFVQNGDTMPYRVLLPLNYDSAKKYPVVFFLHGRGESGSDNQKQLSHGASLFLVDSIRKKYPSIVIFPQCAVTSYWSNVTIDIIGDVRGKRSFHFAAEGEASSAMKLLQSLTDHIREKYSIEDKQVYAMGLSMGGMGVYELVKRKPELFAAAIAICGGAHPATAKRIGRVKWWVFHGAKDEVVPLKASEIIVEALKKVGADVTFTTYPMANHNSWENAFAEKNLLPWLYSKRN